MSSTQGQTLSEARWPQLIITSLQLSIVSSFRAFLRPSETSQRVFFPWRLNPVLDLEASESHVLDYRAKCAMVSQRTPTGHLTCLAFPHKTSESMHHLTAFIKGFLFVPSRLPKSVTRQVLENE